MLRRFSSRRASLYGEFLKPRLAGATRYDRIAGYFQSSLLELASESLAGIPRIRIVPGRGLCQDIALPGTLISMS